VGAWQRSVVKLEPWKVSGVEKWTSVSAEHGRWNLAKGRELGTLEGLENNECRKSGIQKSANCGELRFGKLRNSGKFGKLEM
jgi:hypothetical protein